MASPMDRLILPDALPSLLAILGLLLLWYLHDLQVRAGRIKAVDLRHREGARLFLHLTPDDSAACPACRAASGVAYLPALVTAKEFHPVAGSCTSPAGCRCLLIGLTGAWPEATRLAAQLRESGGRLRLSPAQLGRLLESARGRLARPAADEVALAVVDALRAEGHDPRLAAARYRFAIENAREPRDLALALSCHIRLADLLEQDGRPGEALALVERFLELAAGAGGTVGAAAGRVALMALRKTRLMAALSRTQTAGQAAPARPSLSRSDAPPVRPG